MAKINIYFLLCLAALFLLPSMVTANIDFQTECFELGEFGEDFCIYTGPSLNTTIPEIRIVFDNLSASQVDLVDEELKVIDGTTTYELTKTEESTNPYGAQYMPTKNLPDRDYVFSFSAIDHFGNLFRGNVSFSVNASSLNVWVITPTSKFLDKPLFAMGQNSTFNLELGLERPATCGLTTNDVDVDDLASLYNAIPKFDTNGSRNFLENFSIFNYYTNYQGKGVLEPLNLVCKEENSSRYSFNMIEIGYIDSATTINFNPKPSTIRERNSRRSNVAVNTRDLSVCSIENIEFPEGRPANCQISRLPGLVDYDNLDDFKLNFTEEIAFACGGNPVDQGVYVFETICTNLANYETTENFSIDVVIEQGGDLAIVSPNALVNQEEQTLKISNVMQDNCFYSINSQEEEFSFGQDDWVESEQVYVFETDIVLQEGDNVISAQCNLANEVTKTVLVDKTPPAPIEIKGSTNTCSLTEITLTFESQGNGSPVAFYNYTVSYEEWSVSDTTTSSTITVDLPNNLSGGEQIVVNAFAVDEAGNSNSNMGQRSFTVRNESANECDFTSPLAFLNVTEVEDVTKVQIRCEDEHSGCIQNADVSRHENLTDTCTYSNKQPLTNVYTVSASEKFCYRVYDNAGNNDSGNEIIYPPYRKPEGESCESNGECSTNNCEDNICVQASCSDGIQNGWETGIDCGGGDKTECPACNVGQSCNENADCDNGFCDGGICATPVCANEELQCGGDCELCPEGAECIVGDDCATNYCGEGNTCEQRPEESTTEYPEEVQNPDNTPEESSEEENSLIGYILLILGILMMLGGAGSIGYSQYYVRPFTKKSRSYKSSPGFESVSLPGESNNNKSKINRGESVNQSRLDKKRRRIARRRKKNKRKQLLDEFDTHPSSEVDEKSNNSKRKEKKPSTPPKKEQENNKTTPTKKDKPTKKHEKHTPKKETKKEKDKKQKESNSIDKLKEFNEKNGN